MFTGIIEKSVAVVGVVEGPKFRRLTFAVDWTDVKHGESVAVNGCCLTVAEITTGPAAEIAGPVLLAFDVIEETLSKTNLGLLRQGSKVHVERSLRVGDRIDGHFVQGHVDATALLVERVADDKEWRLILEPPRDLAKYVIPKGSVTLDGVSLTVAAVHDSRFEVALIPTTLALTELANRNVGYSYNLEADVLSKTVVAWLERQKS